MTKHKTYINITKIEKYKKLNMTEHKTGMNITKIDKYKKLNMTEHKTDMNITEKLSTTFTTEHKIILLVNLDRTFRKSWNRPTKRCFAVWSTRNR